MNHNKNEAESQTPPLFSVYVIWCRQTNMHYVGVTGQESVYKRIRQHRRGKQFVDKEIKRIGWEGNWDYWVVEENVPSNRITEREQYWVGVFNSVFPHGYNKTIGGLTLPTAKAGGIPNSTTIAPKIASYMVSKGVNSRVPHGI